MLNWLLIFVPLAAGLEIFAPGQDTFIFLASALAIIPLAGWLGKATEQLAHRTGEGVGGLLNATFGNAAELIIAGIGWYFVEALAWVTGGGQRPEATFQQVWEIKRCNSKFCRALGGPRQRHQPRVGNHAWRRAVLRSHLDP